MAYGDWIKQYTPDEQAFILDFMPQNGISKENEFIWKKDAPARIKNKWAAVRKLWMKEDPGMAAHFKNGIFGQTIR